jgi:phage terminase small subunit
MGDTVETLRIDGEPAQARAVFGVADTARTDEATKIVERFASAYVALGTWAGAYRRCYDCTHMSNAAVWRESHAMSQYPGVRERVRELLAEGAQRAIVTVAEVLRMNMELATANPADVVRVSEHNCRHCHGFDGLYQWRDQDEFATACARELDLAGELRRVPKMPNDAGGYGFTAHRAPNPECETCVGVGEPAVHITDSSKLTGSAARLVKSVKRDRFGAITVELRDQDKALSELARILGAYKDGLAITTPPKAAPELPANLPPERVAAAYLELVR